MSVFFLLCFPLVFSAYFPLLLPFIFILSFPSLLHPHFSSLSPLQLSTLLIFSSSCSLLNFLSPLLLTFPFPSSPSSFPFPSSTSYLLSPSLPPFFSLFLLPFLPFLFPFLPFLPLSLLYPLFPYTYSLPLTLPLSQLSSLPDLSLYPQRCSLPLSPATPPPPPNLHVNLKFENKVFCVI